MAFQWKAIHLHSDVTSQRGYTAKVTELFRLLPMGIAVRDFASCVVPSRASLLFFDFEKTRRRNFGGFGLFCLVQRVRLGVFHDCHIGADPVVFAYRNVIRNGSVYSDKTVFSNVTKTRNDGMGGNKAVVANERVMADMIAAPQHHVVTNFYEWLHRVIFKNEAMLA